MAATVVTILQITVERGGNVSQGTEGKQATGCGTPAGVVPQPLLPHRSLLLRRVTAEGWGRSLWKY